MKLYECVRHSAMNWYPVRGVFPLVGGDKGMHYYLDQVKVFTESE